MTITPLKIQQLVKPKCEAYEPYQTDYFEAYRSHKKGGECLFIEKLPREAYLSFNIAAECLLKGIYDCVKFHYFDNLGSKNQLRILVEKFLQLPLEFTYIFVALNLIVILILLSLAYYFI